MQKFVRILPIFTAVLIFAIFEVVYQAPKGIFIAGVVAPLIFFVVIKLINVAGSDPARGVRPRNISYCAAFRFMLTPTLLVWLALVFSMLVEVVFLRHLLALAVVVFLILFFESMLTYRFRQSAYEGYSLENLTTYALTIAVFLLGSVLIGLHVLLDIYLGLAGLIFLLGILAINYKFFWISRFEAVRALFFVGVLSLVLLELFLVFAVLPFHFMVSGAALTVFWYTGALLTRARLLGLLTKQMTYRHLLLGGILLLFLFLTAQWM